MNREIYGVYRPEAKSIFRPQRGLLENKRTRASFNANIKRLCALARADEGAQEGENGETRYVMSFEDGSMEGAGDYTYFIITLTTQPDGPHETLDIIYRKLANTFEERGVLVDARTLTVLEAFDNDLNMEYDSERKTTRTYHLQAQETAYQLVSDALEVFSI